MNDTADTNEPVDRVALDDADQEPASGSPAVLVSPVQGAAIVHGALGLAVVDGVTCTRCSGTGRLEGSACPTCAGKGTVPPEVDRTVLVATTGEEPVAEIPPRWGFVRPEEGRFQLRTPDSYVLDLYLGAVLGSAAATAPIRIERNGRAFRDDEEVLTVVLVEDYAEQVTDPENASAMLLWWRPGATEAIDLSADLRFLGDPKALIGRWAVLLSEPTPSTERCPTCGGISRVHCNYPGSTLHMGHVCPTCGGARTCEPFPHHLVLPAGTVTAVDLGDLRG